MNDDVKYCVDILNNAIAFEEEGMAYFKKSAEEAGTPVEREMFKSLVRDEAGHRAYLVEMLDNLVKAESIAVLPDVEEATFDAESIFREALAGVVNPQSCKGAALDILSGAMDVERRGYKLYSEAAGNVSSTKAKAIFLHLAAEEQTHYTLLKNTYDYLADPEGFNGFNGNPMLDGG